MQQIRTKDAHEMHSFADFHDLIDSDGDDKQCKEDERDFARKKSKNTAKKENAAKAAPTPAMMGKKEVKKDSASDWYEQLVSKLSNIPTSTEPDQTSTKTSMILLSERADIWDAAHDALERAKLEKAKDHEKSGFKRRLDERLAKLESQDVDRDDFLGQLMKGHTGDAFNDLIPKIVADKKKNKKAKILDSKISPSGDQLVQLNPTVTEKPILTLKKNRYVSDPSVIGTSSTFDNYQTSLPLWHATNEYQVELKRMTEEFNKHGRYTPPVYNISNEDIVVDEKEKPCEQPKFSMLLKKGTPQPPVTSISDDEAELQKIVDESDEEPQESEESDDDSIPSIPAEITHQVLILQTHEQKLDALKEYYDAIVQREQSCRMKSKIVIVVRDGKTANQLIPKIGLKITKHTKSNKGYSNSGLTVHTKGVDMIHERLNEVQRKKAIKQFRVGNCNAIITTDTYLPQLWDFRNQIGYIIHYDIPMVDTQNKNEISNQNMTKEQILQKMKQEDRFTRANMINKMSERLSFLQRLQNRFPDNFYNWNEVTVLAPPKNNNNKKIESDNEDPPNDMYSLKKKQYEDTPTYKILRTKSMKPGVVLKNTSLVFLTQTKNCRTFAQTFAPIYEKEYGAVKTAAALRDLGEQQQ